MTSTTKLVRLSLVCDRCGISADMSEDADGMFREDAWGSMRAMASKPYRIVPDERGDGTMIARGGMFALADLCPPCADELFAWWRNEPTQDCAAPENPLIVTDDRREKVIRYHGYGMSADDIAMVFGYVGDEGLDAFQADYAHELKTAPAMIQAEIIDRLWHTANCGSEDAATALHALREPDQ